MNISTEDICLKYRPLSIFLMGHDFSISSFVSKVNFVHHLQVFITFFKENNNSISDTCHFCWLQYPTAYNTQSRNTGKWHNYQNLFPDFTRVFCLVLLT